MPVLISAAFTRCNVSHEAVDIDTDNFSNVLLA